MIYCSLDTYTNPVRSSLLPEDEHTLTNRCISNLHVKTALSHVPNAFYKKLTTLLKWGNISLTIIFKMKIELTARN